MSWKHDPMEHSLAARGIKTRNIETTHAPISDMVNSDLDNLLDRYTEAGLTLSELNQGIDIFQGIRKIRNKRKFLSVLLYLCELSEHPRTEQLRRMLPEDLNTVAAEQFFNKKIHPNIFPVILKIEDDFLDRTLDDMNINDDREPFTPEFLKQPLPVAHKEQRFSRQPILVEMVKRNITFDHFKEYKKMKSKLDETDPEYNDAVVRVSLKVMPQVLKIQALRNMDEKPRMAYGKAVNVLKKNNIDIEKVSRYMRVIYMHSNKIRLKKSKVELL